MNKCYLLVLFGVFILVFGTSCSGFFDINDPTLEQSNTSIEYFQKIDYLEAIETVFEEIGEGYEQIIGYLEAQGLDKLNKYEVGTTVYYKDDILNISSYKLYDGVKGNTTYDNEKVQESIIACQIEVVEEPKIYYQGKDEAEVANYTLYKATGISTTTYYENGKIDVYTENSKCYYLIKAVEDNLYIFYAYEEGDGYIYSGNNLENLLKDTDATLTSPSEYETYTK